MIVLTRASPTDSRLVRKLLHTIHYAAQPKLRQMPPKTFLCGRLSEPSSYFGIGLYRDVWIASPSTRLATLTGAMCKTSQCELRSLRVNSGMLNVIRIVTYYTLPPLPFGFTFLLSFILLSYFIYCASFY